MINLVFSIRPGYRLDKYVAAEGLHLDKTELSPPGTGKMRNWLSQNKNELADVEKHWQKNGLFKKKKEINKSLLLLGLFIGNLALLGMLFIVA